MGFPVLDQIDLIVLLQAAGWLEAPMRFFTFLGTEQFFMLILPVVYWCIDPGLGIRIGFILLFSNAFNGIVKLGLHGPRPYWLDPSIRALAAESTFGAPSGHAQMAAGIWGTVAARLRQRRAWGLAAGLVFLIGLSRIYLAVHFPLDVLLGWILGALTLWAFIAFWDSAARWAKERTPLQQVLLAFAIPGLLLASGAGFLSLLDGYALPADWLLNAARGGDPLPAPLSMDGMLTAAGSMLGLALGLILVTHRGGFRPAGPVWRRAFCFAVGLIGVLVLYFGLKAVLPAGMSILGSASRFLRYALLGLWIAAGAPLLFIRLGLVEGRTKILETLESAA